MKNQTKLEKRGGGNCLKINLSAFQLSPLKKIVIPDLIRNLLVLKKQNRLRVKHGVTASRTAPSRSKREDNKNRKELINLSTYKPIYSQNAAFTLAEVLITLGIIGVVAAITIPALMTAHKARVLETQYLKSYSIVQQLIRRMENDDIAMDSGMLSQVKNYLTGATYCGNTSIILNHEPDDSPCFYAKSGLYKTFDGKQSVLATLLDDAQYVLPDGMVLLFEWDTLHYKDGSHCWIYVDINGYKKGPNRWGVDLFTFQVIDGKVLAFGDKGTIYTAGGNAEDVTIEKYCNINQSHRLNGLACAHLAKSDTSYFKRVVKLK